MRITSPLPQKFTEDQKYVLKSVDVWSEPGVLALADGV
jgi:hypothetical protein